MLQEQNAKFADIATSSSLMLTPRKIVVSLSREDLDKLNLALIESRVFKLASGEFDLFFVRRKTYWPEESHP